MLRERLLVLMLIPPLAAIIYLGGPLLFVTVAVAAVLGSIEFAQLVAHAGHAVFARTLAAIVLFIAATAAGPGALIPSIVLPVCLLSISIVALLDCNRDGDPSRVMREAADGWATTVSGSLYLGLAFGAALAVREAVGVPVTLLGLSVPYGAAWLAFALLLTWMGDGAAYFVGRSLGKHRLSPLVSPKKTTEGAIGALVMTTALGIACGPLIGLSTAGGAAVGLAAGAAGIAGDLLESLIKRAAGKKDSGTLFPGHGGMLDRIDSVLFVVLLIYCVQTIARGFAA